MGRDVLATTVLREQKLIARSMNCEVDHTVLAKWIQTTERTKDVEHVAPYDKSNQKGAIWTMRLCNRHHFTEWKDAKILKDERIIEGVNNIHEHDLEGAARALNEVHQIQRQLGYFQEHGTL